MLEPAISKFSYMGHEMQSEVLKCPKCGQVYLDEKTVTEKVKHIEEALEDK
jgi:uncharacterized C2H2 Zn-finger protein